MAVIELNVRAAPDAGVTRAEISGPLNRETVPLLEERLEGIHDTCVTLDLAAADYLDSDGVRWLQRLQAQLTARRVELRLRVPEGSAPDRTIKLLKLDASFVIERPARAA
jgi:anti-anti-sigma regulatory factor